MSVQNLPNGAEGALSIVVTELAGQTTIELVGEWDLAAQHAMRDVIRRALAPQPDRMVLDLSRCTFIDSTGVHLITGLAARVARLKIGLSIVPGPSAVSRVFDICQLPEHLALISETEAQPKRRIPAR